MAIIIPGRELPKSCSACPCYNDDLDVCNLICTKVHLMHYFSTFEKKLDCCPLEYQEDKEKERPDFSRFLKVQDEHFAFERAYKEIISGEHASRWMWYIFPRLAGVGTSEMSRFYGLKDINEAKAYLEHPILGARLLDITEAILSREETDPTKIFTFRDAIKLQASLTLFSRISALSIFQRGLDKFFNGKEDKKTADVIDGKKIYTEEYDPRK